MDIFFRGEFGRHAAEVAASFVGDAYLIDLEQAGIWDAPHHFGSKKALVLLSDASGQGLAALAVSFRASGVRWTAVHLYPTMLRVGPLILDDGVCFECATQRYLAAPGSTGLARLEELLRTAGTSRTIEFTSLPASVTTMAVAEAIRQVEDLEVPAGFIRKVDFQDFSFGAAVPAPRHGCACAGHGQPSGIRFFARLERDLLCIIGDAAT